SSRRRHTRFSRDWSSDVCSSDLISVPGDELVVNRHCKNAGHEELGIAIRDAFHAAQRQLRAYSRKRNASTSHTNMRIAELLQARSEERRGGTGTSPRRGPAQPRT